MKVANHIKCENFPCTDTTTESYIIPDIEVDPGKIRIIMISEAPPSNLNDYFYASNDPFYLKTTIQSFNEAGSPVSSMKDILNLGVYVTTAVKCGKTGYAVSFKTVENCSALLEREISLFPDCKALLLMGDTAIKALNCMAKIQTGEKVVPSGSTYKIRGNAYTYRGMRVFPSYLQTGKSFLIEKSKQKMIAEDIKASLEL